MVANVVKMDGNMYYKNSWNKLLFSDYTPSPNLSILSQKNYHYRIEKNFKSTLIYLIYLFKYLMKYT